MSRASTSVPSPFPIWLSSNPDKRGAVTSLRCHRQLQPNQGSHHTLGRIPPPPGREPGALRPATSTPLGPAPAGPGEMSLTSAPDSRPSGRAAPPAGRRTVSAKPAAGVQSRPAPGPRPSLSLLLPGPSNRSLPAGLGSPASGAPLSACGCRFDLSCGAPLSGPAPARSGRSTWPSSRLGCLWSPPRLLCVSPRRPSGSPLLLPCPTPPAGGRSPQWGRAGVPSPHPHPTAPLLQPEPLPSGWLLSLPACACFLPGLGVGRRGECGPKGTVKKKPRAL